MLNPWPVSQNGPMVLWYLACEASHGSRNLAPGDWCHYSPTAKIPDPWTALSPVLWIRSLIPGPDKGRCQTPGSNPKVRGWVHQDPGAHSQCAGVAPSSQDPVSAHRGRREWWWAPGPNPGKQDWDSQVPECMHPI